MADSIPLPDLDRIPGHAPETKGIESPIPVVSDRTDPLGAPALSRTIQSAAQALHAYDQLCRVCRTPQNDPAWPVVHQALVMAYHDIGLLVDQSRLLYEPVVLVLSRYRATLAEDKIPSNEVIRSYLDLSKEAAQALSSWRAAWELSNRISGAIGGYRAPLEPVPPRTIG